MMDTPVWENRWKYYWSAWNVLLLTALFALESTLLDRIVWLLFLPPEIWTALSNDKDAMTLSGFMQWIDSWAKEGAEWWQSWSGLASFMVVTYSVHAGAVVSLGRTGELHVLRLGPVPLLEYGNNLLYGIVAGTTIFVFLLWHFVRSEKTG